MEKRGCLEGVIGVRQGGARATACNGVQRTPTRKRGELRAGSVTDRRVFLL